MDTEELIRFLPKLEQHVHIIGSTRPETLLSIIEENDDDTPLKTIEDVQRFYQYRDFSHFISVYSTVNDYITHPKYYERITYELLEHDDSCNVRHAEIIFSPYDHVRRGLDYGEMLDAINRGIRRAKEDLGVTATIRVDLVRNYGPEIGMDILDWIDTKHDNIVAIDLGGSENEYPPEPYAEVFKRARDLGLHTVAHSGEAAGPESVWSTIKFLSVERIGHCVAAVKDQRLLETLREKKISVEACPVSNLRTGIIKSIRDHPVRSFIKKGIRVSINSDDPSMFNTDMNNEYIQLHRELGFTLEELMKIGIDSIETSFLPERRKEELNAEFLKKYNELISE
jgi:adenosine deaminase